MYRDTSEPQTFTLISAVSSNNTNEKTFPLPFELEKLHTSLLPLMRPTINQQIQKTFSNLIF